MRIYIHHITVGESDVTNGLQNISKHTLFHLGSYFYIFGNYSYFE